MESKLDFPAVNKFFNHPLPKSSAVAPPSAMHLEGANLINIWSTLPNIPISSTHIPSSQIFNPNAPTFVPSHQKMSSIARPAMLTAFWAGASATASEHPAYAKTLVSHLLCTMESMGNDYHGQILSELAQFFCLQASSPESNGLIVAAFAKATYAQLSTNHWAANSFAWHLKDRVVSFFRTCFASTSLSAPLGLCTFVGHLYTESMVSSKEVWSCLECLVREINANAYINHLQAIQILLYQSSEKLWRGKEAGRRLRDFVVIIGQRVSAVMRWGNLSSNGTVGKVRKEDVDKLLKDIVNMLNRWQSYHLTSLG